MYDHSTPRLQSRITELQHSFHERIISTTHVHVDHDNCLEVIIVSGLANNISALADGLQAIRGVRNCNLSVIAATHESSGRHGDHDRHRQ